METEARIAPEEAPKEAPRPKIIRNREVDKAAAAMAEEHAVPIPPGKQLSWDSMQNYLALLTPGMWSHVLIYVYRLKPKIRRQLKDPNLPNYIDCLNAPFTMEHFIGRHGGGRYSLQACDTDAKRDSPTNQLFKCQLDIDDVQHPPILNYEELELEAKENKSYITWLQNKGILDGKGNVIAQQQPGQPAVNGAANLSAKEVLDILGFAQKLTTDQQVLFRQQFAAGDDSLSKSVGTILLEKMKQDDPGKDWDRMMAFIQMMQAQMQDRKPDTSFADMLKMQQEQRKTDLEYTKLLLNNQSKDSGGKSQLSEFREIITFAKEILGAGGNSRRSNWETGLEFAREFGLPIVQSIGNTITNLMMLRSGGPVAAARPANAPAAAVPANAPVAFDPYQNPQAARAYAAATQPPAGPAQAPAAAPAGPENPLLGLFQQYGNLVVNALNMGTPGYDFADYITGLLGTATHAMIVSQGEDALAATMLQVPEIAIFGEPRVRTFVQEFVHYEEYLQGQEDEPEPADKQPLPPPPPPRQQKQKTNAAGKRA